MHPCFCWRSTIGQLHAQAAKAENEEQCTLSNTKCIKFWNCYSFSFKVLFELGARPKMQTNWLKNVYNWVHILARLQVESLQLYQKCSALQLFNRCKVYKIFLPTKIIYSGLEIKDLRFEWKSNCTINVIR